MRPAEVCGCVSRPRLSSSASSARTVDGETSRAVRSISVREPTGWPVATYASTTPRRIAAWRVVSSGSVTCCMAFAGILGQQVRRDASAQEAAALRQRQLSPGRGLLRAHEAEPLEALERMPVQGPLEPVEREGLVEPQPEHHSLALAHLRRKLLELPWRPRAGSERREVATQTRRDAPALTIDCRKGADPEAEVVAGAPVGEVVPRAQVARVREVRRPAEVRRLVPAIAGIRDARDDVFEVRLHRLGLARQPRAVCVRETRPGVSPPP